jgi:hypothetical protein
MDETMASKNPPHDNPASDELHWRETYFIVFPHGRRPTLAQVKQALGKADPRLLLENLAGDAQGRFESVLIESLEDHAAVEVSYETGDAVVEQNLEWAKQLRKQASSQQLQLLMTSDSRLDVAHFERLPAGGAAAGGCGVDLARYDEGLEDEMGGSSWSDDDAADYEDEDAEPDMDMLDPSCLLIVVETLSALTGGLAYDPASGEVL